MRATKAYIASLGTTGVLLAAAILLLAVVSGVVAFDQWPQGNSSTRVQTLTLRQQAAPIRVSARAAAPAATRAARSATPPAAGARVTPRLGTGGRRITAGLNAPVPSPSPLAPLAPVAPLPPAATAPTQPVQDAAAPVIDAISNPSTTTGRVADAVQGVTDAAAVSLGRVSPQVGGAVAGTGQAVAETVRQLPLP